MKTKFEKRERPNAGRSFLFFAAFGTGDLRFGKERTFECKGKSRRRLTAVGLRGKEGGFLCEGQRKNLKGGKRAGQGRRGESAGKRTILYERERRGKSGRRKISGKFMRRATKIAVFRRSEEGKRKESKKACGRLDGKPQRERRECSRRNGRNLCANKNARFPIGKAAVKAPCFRGTREQKKNRNFCAYSIHGAVFPRKGIKKDFLKGNAWQRKEGACFRAENGKGKRERLSFIHKGAWSSIE